jgi:hypothetical protein
VGATSATASEAQVEMTSPLRTLLQSFVPMHDSMSLTISARSFGSAAAFAFLQRFVQVCLSVLSSHVLTFEQYESQSVLFVSPPFCEPEVSLATVQAQMVAAARTQVAPKTVGTRMESSPLRRGGHRRREKVTCEAPSLHGHTF